MTKAKKTTGTFMQIGLKAIKRLRKRQNGYTGEDIRLALEKSSITPSHPNAWGALINKAQIDELIVPTNKFRNTELPSSKGRQARVYAINR